MVVDTDLGDVDRNWYVLQGRQGQTAVRWQAAVSSSDSNCLALQGLRQPAVRDMRLGSIHRKCHMLQGRQLTRARQRQSFQMTAVALGCRHGTVAVDVELGSNDCHCTALQGSPLSLAGQSVAGQADGVTTRFRMHRLDVMWECMPAALRHGAAACCGAALLWGPGWAAML